VNLYAIRPAHAPSDEVELYLAETDDEAMRHGIYLAAKDVADCIYFSPHAEVYRVAHDLIKVGDAQAIDAPREWRWAHPDVAENLAAVAGQAIDNNSTLKQRRDSAA
jgi:hypothetical protein